MIKVRLKFSKHGSMKFIGHLDCMRYFQKAIRRSQIDVAYSKGYSPHQLISFASPLGVGNTSDGEYMDMQLNSMDPDVDIIKALNNAMSEEIQIINLTLQNKESKTAMSLLAGADYLVSIKDGYEVCTDFKERFEVFANQEIIKIVKQTKKSEQEIDLKQFLYAYAFTLQEFEDKIGRVVKSCGAEIYQNGNKVYLQLTCGSVQNVKPDLVMEEFCKWNQIVYNPYAFQIHRMEMYTDINANKGEVNWNGSEKERNLAALDETGE